ncbi:MAG: hypothetical protein Fur0044_08130 [Anaerolineae bacterium]|nr:hypothetical protein [Anaerolineales bacterium]
MKQYFIYALILFALTLSACGGSTPPDTPAAQSAQPAAEQPAPQVRAETPHQAATLALQQQFGLKPEQIKVVSVDEGEWPDSCLGLPHPGESCAQTTTPGYVVTLEAEGRQYIYNVDQILTAARLAFASQQN